MIREVFANIRDGRIEAISLPHGIYPPFCIERVVEAHASECLITSTVVGNATNLSIEVRPEYLRNAREIVWSLLTELLRDASASHLQT
jgi:hypothetical protein